MTQIYPRALIASEVAAGRLNDQALTRQGIAVTEDAVARVARRTGLPAETVAQIAAEEAQAGHAEQMADEAALLEAMDPGAPCTGCGACTNNCGRREIAAADVDCRRDGAVITITRIATPAPELATGLPFAGVEPEAVPY